MRGKFWSFDIWIFNLSFALTQDGELAEPFCDLVLKIWNL
jgi:hypothetical protein